MMMIKTWCCDFNRVPDAAPTDYNDQAIVQRTYNDMLDRLAKLDDSGFEGVFFAEHHFIKSLMPVPNLLIAALAQRTRRIKIGVLGNVLPFHQPWRLAEEIATLDYLTEGRLEIGVSSGVPFEFDFVNIDPDDVRPIYGEILEILDLAMQDEIVNFEGKYFKFKDVPIMPRPREEIRRRRWMSLYSTATAERAATRGYKICSAYQSVETCRGLTEAYMAKADEAGVRVSADDIAVRRQVLVCETDAEAAEQKEKLLAANAEQTARMFAAALDRHDATKAKVSDDIKNSGVLDAAAPSHGPNSTTGGPRGLPMPALMSDDEYIFGSPTTVAEIIINQCRGMGGNNMIAFHPHSLDRDGVRKLYEKMWPKVHDILAKAA
ncbi:LLM class flavin-dependent oxidoreductase [Sphingobium sp. MK2]|uniref:LLM class flavin-dependent oxidoreductase n=1 Tax=Sphingobium sp. MK2 TaxID=3116540 RepID=UPI0032E362D7